MRFLTSASAILAAIASTTLAAPTKPETSAVASETSSASTAAATTVKRNGGLPPLPTDLSPGIHRYAHDAFGQPNITHLADLDRTSHDDDDDDLVGGDGGLVKRVTTWTGCENYGFTYAQLNDVPNAWNSLYNWAANTGSGGYSPWIDGHYFAITSSGTFAYLCQWGSGNHAGLIEINTAKGVVSNVCSGPGMYQWNDWKKGLGVAATGQNWCNGQSYS